MSVPDRMVLARSLVDTYDPPVWEQPWDAVEAYQAYQDYKGRNPDAGYTIIARALGQPQGRIREWEDGSRPDPVRGLHIAERKGWLDIDWDEEQSQGINALLAWSYSGGSIAEDFYVPTWSTPTQKDKNRIHALVRVACDCGVNINERDDEHGDEATPSRNASAFGRFLVALGGHVGPKNAETGPFQVPSYLSGAPTHIRREFAQVCFFNRATEIDADRHGYGYRYRVERPSSYLHSLGSLFEEFVERVTVNPENVTILLSADAKDSLGEIRAIGHFNF